jgi:acetyltransferase-like isoleucine patch superfamily enzyme
LRVGDTIDLLLRDGATYNNITIGDNVSISGRIYIRMRKNGSIVLGNSIQAGTEVWLVTANEATICVGDHSHIGSYCILNGGHGITLGKGCLVAAFVYINSSDHLYAAGTWIQLQGHTGAPVAIGDDVWLGGHVCILKGVTIGDGAVIGAGSVVTKDLPPQCVAVGNPAIIKRYRV